jgi:hypothetical protein
MARYKADTISQIMGHGWWIRVLCRCGNNNTLNPERLLKKGGRAGLSTSVEELRGILKCKLCGQRPWDVHATFKPGD